MNTGDVVDVDTDVGPLRGTIVRRAEQERLGVRSAVKLHGPHRGVLPAIADEKMTVIAACAALDSHEPHR